MALATAGALLRLVGFFDDPLIPLGLFQAASIVGNLGILATLATRSTRRFVRRSAD